MTAHNNRKASNSRNESNNRIANTLWTPAKAGMFALVKPVCREANYSRDIVKIREDSIREDNRNIMNVISSRTARQAVGKSEQQRR
jgi:hypothetical protein